MSRSDIENEWQLALPAQNHDSAPENFHTVTTTLLLNPNVTSSLLFRAEILYDSHNDPTAAWDSSEIFESRYTQHMKAELKPRGLEAANHHLKLKGLQEQSGKIPAWKWRWQRTVVRNLVPRNPQRDKPLVQTCWYLESRGEDDESVENSSPSPNSERHVVIYIPHVDNIEAVPFYHPSVQALAMLYTWNASIPTDSIKTSLSSDIADVPPSLEERGSLQVFYVYFPSQTMSNRLSRTALNLSTTIIKHMAGRAAGYVKRVDHDQVVPQKLFQDTYTRLKLKYAKQLVDGWVEQTDPAKHVFEDLGIAAFLIELWKDMYESHGIEFPGFVDVGCGNGLLVYLLRSEGYEGWGFDLRKRKTWESLPQDIVGGKLEELACVPRILQDSMEADNVGEISTSETQFHDGTFPPGTFIISNHADELTAWTPLLASLSSCPFVAIPCCSHDFGGNKFRAPKPRVDSNSGDTTSKEGSLVQEDSKKNGVESGTLLKRNQKQPSAYAALCTWLEHLTERVGMVAQREMLRIPSTRNAAIVGRHREVTNDTENRDAKEVVREILEMQMSKGLQSISTDWIERTRKIASSKSNGH